MNSISNVPLSPGAKLILFADDILLYKPVSTSDNAALFQQDIDRILSWISSSGLSPNVSKTKFLLVSKSRNVLLMDVEVGSHSLPPCESV